MAYPRRLITPGEEVAVDLNPHWAFFSRQIAVGVGVFVFFLLVAFGTSGGFQSFLWYVVVLAFLAVAVWTVVRYLTWRTTYFVVTSKRIIARSGVVSRRGHEIPLDRISNINFSQKLWERVLGTGDLLVESAGESGQSRFSDITNPEFVQQEIYRQIERYDFRSPSGHGAPLVGGHGAGFGPPGGYGPREGYGPPPGYPQSQDPPPVAPPRAPAGPPPGPASGADIPAQLAQLASLRDRGVLTEAEFEAKKQELLRRL